MILPDTSAWIEYLRATGSAVDRRLDRAVVSGEPVVVTEPVLMEVLAGAKTATQVDRLRTAMLAFPLLPVSALDDYEHAAAIHRSCRASGHTVRNIVDCLIAAIAIRADASVLHRDRDFDAIARCTELSIER